MSHISHGRIFHINTADRVSGTTSNCYVKIEVPTTEEFDRVTVLSAVVPRSYYLVQSPNNTFTLSENGTDTVITIDEGNYSYSSFKTYLQAKLNASTTQGWVYTITTPNSLNSPTTGKYTFTVTQAVESKAQPSFTFPQSTKIHEQMGFNRGQTYTFVSNTLVSANVVKFIPEDTLYIHSDLVNGSSEDILQEMFTSGTSDFGSIYFQNRSPIEYSKILGASKNNSYKIVLTDEDGININLNGLNIVMTILLYKHEDINEMQKEFIKYQIMRNK